MRVTEARFTRKYNVGQYESEEYTLGAALDEGESEVSVLGRLKKAVAAVFSGEEASETTPAPEEEKAKRPRKGKKAAPQIEEETADEDETLAEEEEALAEETAEEEEDDSLDADVDEDETLAEEEEALAEEEEEKPAPKKTASKKAAPAKGGKVFKKKPENYSRTLEQHKEIFSTVLREVAPNWKKTDESKAMAKKTSMKMDGKPFLDENGNVLSSFKAEVKKSMSTKGK